MRQRARMRALIVGAGRGSGSSGAVREGQPAAPGRHGIARRAAVAAGAILAGCALMVPSYAAASVGSPPHGIPAGTILRSGGPIAHRVAPRIAHGGVGHQTVTSDNWSGYAATGGTYTSVSASWVEPTGTCSSGDQYSSFWVGLDGYTSTTVEQTGSEVDCSGSTPQYYSWYEMYPAYPVNFSNPVQPGDHFTGSVTYTGSGNFTLALADTTQGWSHTVTASLASAARSSAEVIVEAPCCTNSGNPLPLADFGTVNFTGATVDGSAIGNDNPTQIDMVSPSGTPEDSVSALTGGENFSVTWESSGNSNRHHPRGGSRPAVPGGRRTS